MACLACMDKLCRRACGGQCRGNFLADMTTLPNPCDHDTTCYLAHQISRRHKFCAQGGREGFQAGLFQFKRAPGGFQVRVRVSHRLGKPFGSVGR